MKYYLILFLLLLFGMNTIAQVDHLIYGEEIAMKRKEIASNALVNLRNGTLLVRLNTSSKQLELLQKMGLTEKLEEVKKEQQNENKSIVEAFQNQLTFTKQVYYFYSENTPEVIDGRFIGILLDTNLNPIKESININYFLIADFNRTENLGIPALVIYDSSLNQMPPPFPYFTRTYESLPIFNRGHDRTVELFNEKLFFEYNKPN